MLEWRPTERPLTRAVLHTLGELPDWRLTLLRTKPLRRGRTSRERSSTAST